MKIGLVLDDTLDKPDGVQAAVLTIGGELTRRGHEVHYLVTDTTRSDIPNVHVISSFYSLQFNANSVRTPKPASKKKIKELLDTLELDVVHVQMPYSPLMAGKVVSSVPKATKVYGTFHILPYDNVTSIGTRLLGLWLKKNLKRFDGFYAVSPPARDFMEQTFGVESSVLPNPIDYSFFNSFKKQGSDKVELVFVGRFDKRKGVEQLVEAYSKLPKAIINRTNLTMCGKGPLLEHLHKKVKKKGLKIDFPGFVSDEEKAQYLANADIAVFPSVSGESFGIVLAEAMAAEAGVTIGGNNPGYSSVLSDFPDVLFDPNDIGNFSKKLEHFVVDTESRKEIGTNQHRYVKKFDIKKIVDELIQEYSK